MPPSLFSPATLSTGILLTGCSFFGWGGQEADAVKSGQDKALYYELAGHPDEGWELAEEDNLKEVERLIVTSSTMLGFRRKLHFDRLVPFKPEYLKKDHWHLISFDQREAATSGEASAEAATDGEDGAEAATAGEKGAESGSLLIIKLEWLGQDGEVQRASVEVNNPGASPPSRDVFDELFELYVTRVTAKKKRAAGSEDKGGDAGSPKAEAASKTPETAEEPRAEEPEVAPAQEGESPEDKEN